MNPSATRSATIEDHAVSELHDSELPDGESRDSLDARLDALARWLSDHSELGGLALTPASGDASFRRYFRVQNSAGSWIAMDAPPPMEACGPFIDVAKLLRAMSLNVPEIVAADLEQGFVLMTDLGERQYQGVLEDDPSRIDALYEDAVVALVRMQQEGAGVLRQLPLYDEELLRFEMSLFRDWLVGRHLGSAFTKSEAAAWTAACDLLVGNALAQTQVFVHRDYHSRNLMLVEDGNPGILDFQDAVQGPITYDLVSLLKDCYLELPHPVVRRFAMRFCDAVDDVSAQLLDREAFWRSFELMGVQRHLKAAGIFARLLHRDGKAGYMPEVPRTLRYIVAVAPRYPELAFLGELIETRYLPALGERA